MQDRLKDVLGEFYKFALVGILQIGLSIAVFSFIEAVYPRSLIPIKLVLSYATSACVAYFVSARFVFQTNLRVWTLMRYQLGYAPSLMINYLFLGLTDPENLIPAQSLLVIGLAVFNFFVQKIFTFGLPSK